MATFELLCPKILNHEGGYQDDKADSGNYFDSELIGTNRGISAPTLAAYLKRKPTVADMKAVTKDTAIHIMKSMYWDKFKADMILNQSVAEILVDWLFISGTKPVKFVQEYLELDIDGIVGNKTITAINQANQYELHAAIKNGRIAHVEAIVRANPKKAKFLLGWKVRIKSFEYKPI